MKCILVKVYFPSQVAFVEKHGDDVWNMICDHFPVDAIFKVSDVRKLIMQKYNCAQSTAHNYAKAVMENCALMPEGGLFRAGPARYRFHDISGK